MLKCWVISLPGASHISPSVPGPNTDAWLSPCISLQVCHITRLMTAILNVTCGRRFWLLGLAFMLLLVWFQSASSASFLFFSQDISGQQNEPNPCFLCSPKAVYLPCLCSTVFSLTHLLVFCFTWTLLFSKAHAKHSFFLDCSHSWLLFSNWVAISAHAHQSFGRAPCAALFC